MSKERNTGSKIEAMPMNQDLVMMESEFNQMRVDDNQTKIRFFSQGNDQSQQQQNKGQSILQTPKLKRKNAAIH